MFRFFFAGVVATCLIASSAFSATHQVPATFTNIQDAIDAAAPGDIVLVSPGVYSGDGNRDIEFRGKGVLLRSEGGSARTVIDCSAGFGEWHRAFHFCAGEGSSSVVEGFTILNGMHQNGAAIDILCNSGPVIRDCVIRDCVAQFGGGAVRVTEGSWPTFERCYFEANSAASGGAVMVEGASYPSFDRCVLAGNSATMSGGALFVREGSECTMNQATFYANSALFFGGAIFCDGGAAAELQASIISFTGQGEAVECRDGGSATLSCSDVWGNLMGDWTGCIAGQLGIAENFSADPRFCMSPGFSLFIRQGSPCVWRNGCMSQIGALGQGCPRRGPAVEPQTGKIARSGDLPDGDYVESSWGTIKHRFHGD